MIGQRSIFKKTKKGGDIGDLEAAAASYYEAMADASTSSSSASGQKGVVQLTPVEAFRACILLDEALKQLQFVSRLSPGIQSLKLDELPMSKGDEIVRIIKEQKQLEEEYKELTEEKQHLQGLENIDKLRALETKLQDISHRLREANRDLCRNLKQNPNLQENVLKLQLERQKVEEWYTDVRDELREHCTFKTLLDRVAAEKHRQEKLNEIKKRTRESTQAVRLLEAELKKETAEYEREAKQANAEISTLKEELQQNRLRSALKLSFEEKQLAAREEAQLRAFKQEEFELQQELEKLQADAGLEDFTHSHVIKFSRHYIQKLHDDRHAWQGRAAEETAQKDAELSALLKQRNSIDCALDNARQRLDEDQARRERAEKEAMLKATILAAKAEQLKRQQEAAVVIRQVARLYLKKVQAAVDAEMAAKGRRKKKQGASTQQKSA